MPKPEDDDSRRPENTAETGSDVGANPGERDAAGRFAAGSTGNPGGRPKSAKDFKALARSYSEMALKKLYQIALTGSGAPQVRACEVIIERAWGRVEPVKAAPTGGPIEARFHGAVRSAVEAMVAKAEADERLKTQAEADGPKN